MASSGSRGGTVKLWRVSDWSEVHTLRGFYGDLAFSLDGNILVSGSADGIVRLWGVGP
jgi:WD40 repeat protein